MMNDLLINIDDRYGGPENVTLADYQELNPSGRFEYHQASRQIVEWLHPNARAPIVVAVSVAEYNEMLTGATQHDGDDLPY